MKRTLSSSVLRKKAARPDEEAAVSGLDATDARTEGEAKRAVGVKPRVGGSGSAWKAGALSDASQILQVERAQVVERILSGRHELQIDASQIVDVIGSDRREDWREQEAYERLKESIEKHGQDTPIHVWPADPNWRPDEREPESVEGVVFHLIVGRRRHAILEELGRPVRAILVPQSHRGSREEQFETLFMRFRENEERENLSAFERLMSIGEMFERLQEATQDEKLTATEFAKRVGLHNSAVSRGRAVYASRDEILHACKNVYELSHRDLEQVLNDLSGKPPKPAQKKPSRPRKLSVQRKIGSRKLSVTGQGDKLSVAASGLTLNEDILKGLSDVIAEYLEKHGSN